MRKDKGTLMVSIIIPVLNNALGLAKVLISLFQQKFPKSRLQVIVVDNGSRDNIVNITQKFPVELIKETSYKSPYLCRNRGIKAAKGDIIILLDSTCIPQNNFLKAAIDILEKPKIDFAVGKINFTFSKKKTIGEMADSLTFFPNKRSVELGFGVPAGVVFVWKYVFEKGGLFKETLRAGGDIEWSKRMLDLGFKYAYSDEAIVNYKARGFKALMRKAYRGGKGYRAIYKIQNAKLGFRWYVNTLWYLLPPNPFKLKRRIIEDTNDKKILDNFWKVYSVVWLFKLYNFIGMIKS